MDHFEEGTDFPPTPALKIIISLCKVNESHKDVFKKQKMDVKFGYLVIIL